MEIKISHKCLNLLPKNEKFVEIDGIQTMTANFFGEDYENRNFINGRLTVPVPKGADTSDDELKQMVIDKIKKICEETG